MTLLAIKLFLQGALGRLLSALRWVMAHPWQAALLCAVAVSFWQNHTINRVTAERDQARTLIAEMQAKAKQVRTQSVTIAKESDHVHETRLADNRASTRAYIASHRLRPESGISAPAENPPAGTPEKPAAEAIVAVTEADVQICATNYTLALSAYEWAKALRDAGLAD